MNIDQLRRKEVKAQTTSIGIPGGSLRLTRYPDGNIELQKRGARGEDIGRIMINGGVTRAVADWIAGVN